METLDDILRYNAVGMLLWLCVLIFRDLQNQMAGRFGAFSAFCAACYLIASKPGLTVFGIDVDYFTFPFAVINPAMAWLFCLTQFDDHFRLRPWHLGVVAAKFVTGVYLYLTWRLGIYSPFDLVGWAGFLVIFGILGHITYVAWWGQREDLVEARRRFRRIFATGVVVISIGVMIAEVFLVGTGINQYLLVLQSSSFLAMALYLHWRLTAQFGADLFPNMPLPAAEAIDPDRAPADRHDLDVIERLERDGFVLEQGLTIARMAEAAAIPEHRLRRLINQHLGYRNFADYLNHHRIEAAQARLADVKDRNLPVLTIAMDLGYGSLGPFNRAFKERTGLTPTEYRRKILANAI